MTTAIIYLGLTIMRMIHWIRIQKLVIFWAEQNTALFTINLKNKVEVYIVSTAVESLESFTQLKHNVLIMNMRVQQSI